MTIKREPAFQIGDEVLEHSTGRTGKVLSLEDEDLIADVKRNRYKYRVMFGNDHALKREPTLALITPVSLLESLNPSFLKRAAHNISLDRSQKPIEVLQRYSELVAILSGEQDGCMHCSHLELTTKGRKRVCVTHRRNKEGGVR